MTYNVSVRESTQTCADDGSIYSALQLDDNDPTIASALNLTHNDDLEMFKIHVLRNMKIDIRDIVFLTTSAEDSLLLLENVTEHIDFVSYLRQLQTPATSVDLHRFADDLHKLAKRFADVNDTIASDDVMKEVMSFYSIMNTSVADMREQRDLMANAVTSAQSIINALNITESIDAVNAAESALANQTDQILASSIEQLENETKGILSKLKNTTISGLKHEVGRCRVVYDSLLLIVHAPCLHLLHPVNALWFCYGWYSTFSVFLIIATSHIIAMIRAGIKPNKVASASILAVDANENSTLHVVTASDVEVQTDETGKSKATMVTSLIPQHGVSCEVQRLTSVECASHSTQQRGAALASNKVHPLQFTSAASQCRPNNSRCPPDTNGCRLDTGQWRCDIRGCRPDTRRCRPNTRQQFTNYLHFVYGKENKH